MKVEILTEDQAIIDIAYPVEVKVYEAGVQLKPASATLTAKDPDGNEVRAAIAMTVNSTSGTMTYTIIAGLMDTLWENAILEIAYVMGTGGSAVTYAALFFFDVVLNALKCNVIDADLKAYSPKLASLIWATQTTYDTQIQEAFRLVKRLIKDKGRRPAMILDGAQVRELVILKSFEMICMDFAKAPDDIWWLRYQKYAELFKAQFDGLRIKYDEDESGTIDTDEAVSFSQPTLLR